MAKNTWVCITCGGTLGILIGQELLPVDGAKIRTQGANLVITCPHCGSRKIWYPADPLLRVLKQLIDVIATETAKAAIKAVSNELSQLRQEAAKSIGESNGD
jgi:DNA-directed RNA polymerase subunit RPC12/RpoP